MKTQIHDLRKVRMWYEVKELSSNPGNSDSKIAKKLGIDRRTVSRYKKMSEDEFHEFSMKQRVYELVLSPYYPDVLSLLSIDNGLPAAVIEDRLKEKYPDLPKVNSKTVYNFVQHVRRQEKIPVPEKIRQTEALEEFAYGSQAQGLFFCPCPVTQSLQICVFPNNSLHRENSRPGSRTGLRVYRGYPREASL